MLTKAIEKILELAKPNIVDVHGDSYTDKALHYVPYERMAPVMMTHTLSSIVDYLTNGTDDVSAEPEDGLYRVDDRRYVIHVEDYNKVSLKHELNFDRNRETLMTATDDTTTFPFNRYMDIENFIVAVQAFFLQDDTTAKLLQLVSHITDSNSVTQSDDGCTQTVTAKTGILTAAQVALPNPVQLTPLCTFTEAEQPMRQFVFRLRGGDGINAALFEADGNAWKREAIQNIKAYFAREIPKELCDDVIILA